MAAVFAIDTIITMESCITYSLTFKCIVLPYTFGVTNVMFSLYLQFSTLNLSDIKNNTLKY